ncbi:MAG: SpoIVB peptidase [Clostridiales bacterium]|nr:SpoIVB peptidase [Clostridiales bacterium]
MKKILKFSGILILISILSIAIGFIFVSSDYQAFGLEHGIYLGGTPIVIVAKGDALVITQFVSVITENGAYSPALRAGLQRGDIVISANGQKAYDIFQLNNIIANSTNEVVLEVKRNGHMFTVNINPVYDLSQNAKKIGLQVKGDLSGIGTLTYITEDNCYGALGHRITDEFNYSEIYQTGKIFNCHIEGFVKGEQGKAGELKGRIVYDQQCLGSISKNSLAGLFGKINANEKTGRPHCKIAGRNQVKAGKAQIYTTIDQGKPQFYDIEIVKAQKQDSIADKGLVIRVTDKRLLQQTGGILQGMSGSPILQNGCLVGAVTHVFISDPTMGYGVYIEWMTGS